jgi:hypothetical protein
MWSAMNMENGAIRLMPGIRTREYINSEKNRRAGDEKRTARPMIERETMERDGSQGSGAPKASGSLQSHMPMAAMSERCMEPMVRTGARKSNSWRRLKTCV